MKRILLPVCALVCAIALTPGEAKAQVAFGVHGNWASEVELTPGI